MEPGELLEAALNITVNCKFTFVYGRGFDSKQPTKYHTCVYVHCGKWVNRDPPKKLRSLIFINKNKEWMLGCAVWVK